MPISERFVVKYTGFLLAIGFLTLLCIVGMTVWLGERAQTYANDAIQERDTRASAVELRSAVQSAESAQRGFLISGNEIYLAPYDSAKVSVQRQLDRLKVLLRPYKETEAMLRRLSVIIAEKIDEMDRTIVLKKEQRDSESLSIFRTNRGKALLDEANVFLSSVIRATDERLTTGVIEQRENAARLRWVSLIGGIIIVLVVGGVTLLGIRYALEIAKARDEVHNLNINLEQRVKERTSALGRALDRAEVLLAEVNHRVANSLMMVASLVRLQSNALQNQDAKDALAETEARIHAISDVHKRLYSSGDVRLVALDEYLSDLLKNLQNSMQNEGHGASLDYHLEPLKLPTDSSINLGVVVTEWVTNAFKYAYPQRRGEVRVNLKRLADGRGELLVEDDGVGRIDSGAIKGTGLGTRLVKAMAGNLGGEIDYFARQPGTLARLTFPVPAD
jgi:two-component sensor histidine kinase/CHASE3 domain sensor protein